MTKGDLSEDWDMACFIQVYKGRDDKNKHANNRGIIILSITWNLYSRILINRVAEDQGGLKMARNSLDQTFALRHLVEIYREKKDLYIALMNLQKEYGREYMKNYI